MNVISPSEAGVYFQVDVSLSRSLLFMLLICGFLTAFSVDAALSISEGSFTLQDFETIICIHFFSPHKRE